MSPSQTNVFANFYSQTLVHVSSVKRFAHTSQMGTVSSVGYNVENCRKDSFHLASVRDTFDMSDIPSHSRHSQVHLSGVMI